MILFWSILMIFLYFLEHCRNIFDMPESARMIEKAKFYVKLHKCSFFQTRVKYLGFDVSVRGIQPSLEKVKTIVEWPTPKSVKDVCSFLGLAGFYRRFIKDFSLKARPMTDLTKEGMSWKWDEEEENSFCELKRSLVVAPVLKMPDFDRLFVVTTDASLVSIGAILAQDFGQGLQPVAYESRKFNPSETRYSAYERDLLGIVWAIGKWRHYLEGKHFIVQTDHSSLKHLPNQPSANRRIWKWVSILQGYDIEIRHIPGKVNPADALTRQIKGDDIAYTGQVKRQDQDWVETIRVPSSAMGEDIQIKLRRLYSKTELREKGEQIHNRLMIETNEESNAVLSIAESQIIIDAEMRR